MRFHTLITFHCKHHDAAIVEQNAIIFDMLVMVDGTIIGFKRGDFFIPLGIRVAIMSRDNRPQEMCNVYDLGDGWIS